MDPFGDHDSAERDTFSGGLGDNSLFSGLETTDFVGLDDGDEGNAPPSPSASQFEGLRLDSGTVGGGAGPSTSGADADIDDDPFAALEAAIEEDKPKTEPSDEWKRMLEAIEQEEAAGTPDMVPDEAAVPAPAEDATAAAAADVVDMDTIDAQGNGDATEPPPVLLHPDRSPSRVLAQQASDSTASGGSGGGDGDADSHGEDLAGSRGAAPPAASPDPALSLEDLRRASFAALQPVCSRLLQQRSDPGGMGTLLEELTQVIKRLEPAGLQACVDYVIFPLQVTLDGIAATRGGSSSGDAGGGAGAALPALRSDRASEAALAALLALLERARCSKGEQLIGLLHRLSAVIALPRERAIEDIRLGALKVATAALLPVDRDAALQSALREEDTAPLVGHLSSLLLRAAEAELAAGRGGSKAVRAEALRALRVLIEAINSPEALSFFLPGLASGLARALLAGGGAGGRARATQGPAASGAAAAQALGALTALLVATLGNAAVGPVIGESLRVHSTVPAAADPWASISTSTDALEELILLSKRSTGAEAHLLDASGANEARPLPPALAPPAPGEQPRLRVDRSEEWIRASAARIEDMLGTVVPPLATDPRPVVREAAVNTCATLVSECSLALAAARPALADVVFALAQDEWPAVSAAARGWLASPSPSNATANASTALSTAPLLLSSAESSLAGWIAELPAALRKSDEAGRAHALKIVTALEACPPAAVATRLTANAAEASRVVAALSECWELDADSAGLMLLAVPDSGAYGGGEGPSRSGDASAPAATLLPRMPMGMRYISTKQTYAAVAAVVRTLAAAAAAADAAAAPNGGTALRSLVEGCLEHLERMLEAGDAAPGGAGVGRKGRGPGRGLKQRKAAAAVAGEGSDDLSGASGGLGAVPWQLNAAQGIITLTELLFGASPAWSLLSGLAAAPGAAAADASKAAAELEALVALVLPDVVDERIWALLTALTTPSSSGSSNVSDSSYTPAALPSSAPGFTPRDRGSNALLQRAALDCVGAAARALGARFSSSGRLLRAVLLPALEKLGDPCRIVSAAADSAIASICAHGGYAGASGGGMRALVADNADYIVDGLCRQLRQPESHPRAPHLFSALLSHGGVAPGLVPLLAEPAAAALRGVSIVARRRRPEHVLSFVMCLREISRGAGLVSSEAAAKLEGLAAEVRGRHEAAVAEKRALMESLLGETDAPDAEKGGKKASIEEIGRFFAEQRAKKECGGDGDADDAAASIEHDTKVSVSVDEWNEVLIARRRAVGCATLAQSAVDTLGPLALSTSLPVAVQSLWACCDALDALSVASKAVETCKKEIDPIISPPAGVLSPTEKEAPALLPSVHLLWSPLIGALGDWRVAVVESVLRVLSHLAGLAGSFLARRFAVEAWPLLRRLLAEGPSQRRLIAPGQDDLTSPTVVQRAQRAALACLRDIATGGEGAAAVVAPVAAPAMAAAADLMGDSQPALVVREEATRTFTALAALDPDAGWALLAAALRAAGTAALPAALATHPGGDLPPLAAVCPVPSAGAVPKGLRTCGAGKLQALMAQVGALPVPWHTQIEARLAAVAAP